MPKYWALGAALAVSIGWPFAAATADVTIPDEYAKLIQDHGRIGTLDGGFFGDRVGLSTGSLEFVQTDVDLAGNDALAVRVGRRFRPGGFPARGHFADWDLDIPHLHGVFGDDPSQGGWTVDSTNRDHRCTELGPPAEIFPAGGGAFSPDDFWQGSFLYLPGNGDQELLIGGDTPAAGGPYTAVTREGAAVRCLSALAPTSEAGSSGEGFEVVTPDGTIYRFDQMVSRSEDGLFKPEPAPLLRAVAGHPRVAPGNPLPRTQGVTAGTDAAATCCRLSRREIFMYPTKVTDRFGNSVTYSWSSTNPWRLLQIASSDGQRSIDLGYSTTDPDSILVQSVTSGGRTWNYTYADVIPNVHLASVTQPDLRTWQFSLLTLYRDAKPTPSGVVCDSIYTPTGSSWIGTITAPSGAKAEYTLAETLFGRSWGFRDCKVASDLSSEYVTDPYLFVNVAITGKTITGPGLPIGGLTWSYAYGAPNNCWNPSGAPTGDADAIVCTQSSPVHRTTTVTGPDGAVSRYTFGNRVLIDLNTAGNEGLLLGEEHGVIGASALRTTTNRYGEGNAAPYGAHQGFSLRRRGDWMIAGQRRPQLSGSTVLQGETFSWNVPQACGSNFCFDTRARPMTTVRSGPNGATRTESTTYYDDTSLWVLGQVAQVKCIAPATSAGLPVDCGLSGVVMSENTYDAATALAITTKSFGKLKSTFAYDTISAVATGQRGTLKTVKDGNNNITTYTNWKRGIPQSVAFADGNSRTAVVDGRGWITSVTDENGYVTGYAYDAMGRITQVIYPTGDSVAWVASNSVFEPVTTAEQGVSAGHWRETTHTGNGYKVTLFDALWRPVLIHEYDAGTGGTDRWVATAYDKAGRVVDASYPMMAAPTMLSDATWQSGTARPSGVRTNYDALGRPTSVVQDAEAAFGTVTTSTAYLTGFQRRITDARGNATTESFLAWDTPTFELPVQIDAPENQRTAIARDIFGKPITITRGEVAP